MANGSTDAVCGPLELEPEPGRLQFVFPLALQHQQSGTNSPVRPPVAFQEEPCDSIIVTTKTMRRRPLQSAVGVPAAKLPKVEKNKPQGTTNSTASSSSSCLPQEPPEQPNQPIYLQPLQVQLPPEQPMPPNPPRQEHPHRVRHRTRRDAHEEESVTSPFSLKDVWRCPNHIWRKMKVLRDRYQEDLQHVYSHISKKVEKPRPPEDYHVLKYYTQMIREQLFYLNSARSSLPKDFDEQRLKTLERQMFYALDSCPFSDDFGRPLCNRLAPIPNYRPF